MFGSKAACCSAGGHLPSLEGLQPPSLPAATAGSNCRALFIRKSASFPTWDSKYYVLAVVNGASPSSRLRRFATRRPVCGSRKPALDHSFSLASPALLLTAASWPPRKVSGLSASSERIPSSDAFVGDQFHARTRPCRVLNADANPEVEVEEDELPAEVKHWAQNEDKINDPVQPEQPQNQEQQQRKKLKNRIVFGLGIGAGFLGIVLAGGWVFTLAFSCTIWYASGEYFDLLRSKGNIARGLTPPPPVAAKVCSAICAVMPIMTLYYGGRMGVLVTTSAFALATVLLLQKVPRFSQLTSAIFGLIYCGYLPSFWIKLRCGLAVPALNTRIAAGWPILLGGQAHWTVGLVATIISCTAIAAADTFSFLGGKTFGRTPLISISPKKTLEGAAVGLSCTIAVTILLSKLFQWPSSTPSAAVLAVLVFMSSLFGDLTESMMKRDAGVKDSGHLIPGHGGILDRVDSYIFTGALVYSFVKIGLPLFGV